MNRLLFAVLLLTLTSTSFGQFTYAPINVPGAAATEAGHQQQWRDCGFLQDYRLRRL